VKRVTNPSPGLPGHCIHPSCAARLLQSNKNRDQNLMNARMRSELATVEDPAPSEWWYSDLLEYTHDAIIVWALGGEGIVYFNRAAEQLYGYSRDEVYGEVTHQLLNTQLTSDISELETSIARYGIWVGELTHTARDGRLVQVKARMILLPRVDDRWLVAEINREITTR
jgi:PAS domain S-box-containing protein